MSDVPIVKEVNVSSDFNHPSKDGYYRTLTGFFLGKTNETKYAPLEDISAAKDIICRGYCIPPKGTRIAPILIEIFPLYYTLKPESDTLWLKTSICWYLLKTPHENYAMILDSTKKKLDLLQHTVNIIQSTKMTSDEHSFHTVLSKLLEVKTMHDVAEGIGFLSRYLSVSLPNVQAVQFFLPWLDTYIKNGGSGFSTLNPYREVVRPHIHTLPQRPVTPVSEPPPQNTIPQPSSQIPQKQKHKTLRDDLSLPKILDEDNYDMKPFKLPGIPDKDTYRFLKTWNLLNEISTTLELPQLSLNDMFGLIYKLYHRKYSSLRTTLHVKLLEAIISKSDIDSYRLICLNQFTWQEFLRHYLFNRNVVNASILGHHDYNDIPASIKLNFLSLLVQNFVSTSYYKEKCNDENTQSKTGGLQQIKDEYKEKYRELSTLNFSNEDKEELIFKKVKERQVELENLHNQYKSKIARAKSKDTGLQDTTFPYKPLGNDRFFNNYWGFLDTNNKFVLFKEQCPSEKLLLYKQKYKSKLVPKKPTHIDLTKHSKVLTNMKVKIPRIKETPTYFLKPRGSKVIVPLIKSNDMRLYHLPQKAPQWFMCTSNQQVQKLKASLNIEGARECALRDNISHCSFLTREVIEKDPSLSSQEYYKILFDNRSDSLDDIVLNDDDEEYRKEVELECIKYILKEFEKIKETIPPEHWDESILEEWKKVDTSTPPSKFILLIFELYSSVDHVVFTTQYAYNSVHEKFENVLNSKKGTLSQILLLFMTFRMCLKSRDRLSSKRKSAPFITESRSKIQKV